MRRDPTSPVLHCPIIAPKLNTPAVGAGAAKLYAKGNWDFLDYKEVRLD
jgi:hypothetical protein